MYCIVRLAVSAYYYDKGVKKGLSFALNGVQFVRDAQPFGNPFDAKSAFAPIASAASAPAASIDGMFA